MKSTINKFIRDEDGNNLVVGLIILGVVALPLVFFIAKFAGKAQSEVIEEGDEIFNGDFIEKDYGSHNSMIIIELGNKANPYKLAYTVDV